MLKIDLSKRVAKFLAKQPPKLAKQIAQKLMALRDTPFPSASKKLTGSTYFRADIGEYRIIYQAQHETLYVILIGKRNDNTVYKQFNRLT